MSSFLNIFRISSFFIILLLSASCATTIVTQNIPVSTNPFGAEVIVDGKPSCLTPCSVTLPRNQDHLLTFIKSGYRQYDVNIKRQHQTEMELLKAINSGVNTGTFFKDTSWGLNSAVQSLSTDQATGEAYMLVPSTVAVTLIPSAGFPTQSSYPETTHGLLPLDLMDSSDEHMLETALETSPTKQPSVWSNQKSGISFAVEAEEAETVNGYITRYFTIGVKKGDEYGADRYSAYRVGRGEWVIGEPTVSTKTPDATPSQTESDSSDVIRALGESPWPSVQKDWKLKESGTTSTKYKSDGSVTTKSSSSSIKAGVGINPGAIFGILDALKSIDTSQ